MTKTANLALGVVVLALIQGLSAQEAPSPAVETTASPTATINAEAEPSATPALSPSVAPTTTPAPLPPSRRNIRISFLPPPLEGKISLGIYNEWGQLVRVLHQEAGLDEFTVGADALVTKWDGRDDYGQDLPAGRYTARGYLVANLKVDDVGKVVNGLPDMNAATTTAQIKLMPNPLANDERSVIAISVGFDDENSFLKTADGLPLWTLSKDPSVARAAIKKNTEKSVDVWQDNGTAVEQFHVSNVDQMMAFDCGKFELK
jgi:hypothetical protein